MNSRTLTHRMIIIAKELRADGIHHRTRSIIEGTRKCTKIRNRHIITRLIMQRTISSTRLPLRVFQTFYTLKVDNVRISTLYTERTHTMQVEQKMMLCRTFSDFINGIDSFLIIPGEEIHLESLDAHIAIMLHDFLHFLMSTLYQITP